MHTAVATGLRAGVVVMVLALASAAHAQSFLQSLFGGSPQPRVEYPMSRPGVPAMAVPSRQGGNNWREPGRDFERYSPASSRASRDGAAEGHDEANHGGGKYRTLCVRTCDGYYFPISNSVSRARFMRDAAQCRANCGEEARLHYLPANSDNVSTMLDLAGRSYLRMPTAFRYRKSLTNGCTCRPMPWSEAELQRHRQYAAEAAEAERQRLVAEAAEAAHKEEVAARSKRYGKGDKAPRNEVAKVEPPKSGADVAAASAAKSEDGDEATAATAAMASASQWTPEVVVEPAEAETAKPAVRTVEGRTEGSRTAAVMRTSDRVGDRGGARSGERPADRPAARRQQAVLRNGGGAPAYGGGSWLPTSGGGKYTWPGDAPGR